MMKLVILSKMSLNKLSMAEREYVLTGETWRFTQHQKNLANAASIKICQFDSGLGAPILNTK